MLKRLKSLIVDRLRWVYWYPFRITIQQLNFGNLIFVAKLTGTLVYLFASRRREIIRKELILSLGKDCHGKKLRNIVYRSFLNFYQTQLEFFLYPKLNPARVNGIVRIEGKENLDQALARGKGAILLFSHFGANQMIMPAIGYNGYKMNQLSISAEHWKSIIPENSSPINRRILKLRWEYEQSLPAKHINAFGLLRPAIKCLKNNEVLGIALDGGAGKKELRLEFLGRKASFSSGPMNLARHTGATLLPTFIIRNQDGRHKLVIHERMDPINSSEKENTQKFVALMESYIKRYPCHYAQFLWLARKFTQNTENPFFADYDQKNHI